MVWNEYQIFHPNINDVLWNHKGNNSSGACSINDTFPSTCMLVKCNFVHIPKPSLFLSWTARTALISSAVRKFIPNSRTCIPYLRFFVKSSEQTKRSSGSSRIVIITRWSSSQFCRRTRISVNIGGFLPRYKCWIKAFSCIRNQHSFRKCSLNLVLLKIDTYTLKMKTHLNHI